MAGRYLATELQDDNGDVIYPHTEADIVYASDGTTVEENLNGEITEADMQEVFAGSQPETVKKLSVKEKIKNAIKRYQALLGARILDTVEEVEANTDDGYLMGAKAGAALINDLMTDIYVGDDGKLHKIKGGADTVLPFSSGKYFTVTVNSANIPKTATSSDGEKGEYVGVSNFQLQAEAAGQVIYLNNGIITTNNGSLMSKIIVTAIYKVI